MAKKSEQLKEKIFDAYSSAVLEQEKEPKSVYLFCKELGISEAEFYQYFGSLNHVKGQIFCQFFDNALGLIIKGKEFAMQRPKEKLLSFYFTFFEGSSENNPKSESDPHKGWFYSVDDLRKLTDNLDLNLSYIGNWGHPRNQKLALITLNG